MKGTLVVRSIANFVVTNNPNKWLFSNSHLMTTIKYLKREKCPIWSFFRYVFSCLYLQWIWRNTEYLSVFCPNAGKYRPEKLRRWTLFTQCWSVFSRIRTEYGEIRSISPYSGQMRENMDRKNSEHGHVSRIEYFEKKFLSQRIGTDLNTEKYLSFMEIEISVSSVQAFQFTKFYEMRLTMTNTTIRKVSAWHSR